MAQWYGIDLGSMNELLPRDTSGQMRQFFRIVASINQLFFFAATSLIFSIYFYQKRWANFLRLDALPQPNYLIVSLLLLVCSFPIIQLSMWFNQQIPLPDWAITAEENAAAVVGQLLTVDSATEWLSNMLVIAVITAISEELFFRGIIQQKLLAFFKKPHLAIWVGAMIFSAFHGQFEGFIPRMLLGALLGYVYYWSSNLWIPIILHFFNNGLMVTGAYVAPEALPESVDIDISIGMVAWAAAAGFGIWGIIRYRPDETMRQE